MAKVRCQECEKEIVGGVKIEEFDPKEPTTIHVFCSDSCRNKWLSDQEKKKK